jgi:putative tricarboxylic transport membrane protein
MFLDRIIFVVTIVIAGAYLYSTTNIPSLEIGDPLGPRAFPYLLGIALLIAAGFLGVEMWRNRLKTVSPEEASPFDARSVAVLSCITVWTGCYYLAFEPLGFIVATSVYLLPMMAWFNRGKWLVNIVSAVLFSGFTYLLFVKLEVNLPKGILPF